MSRLREAAEDYLMMRRTLGFKLTSWARHLRGFIDYCEAHHAERITTELALAWATQTPRGSSDEAYWSRRLMVVRIFARHLKTLDPATEVPPEDVLPHHYRRIAPYLYSPQEIAALIRAAGRLQPPLRAATWQTLIGLLAVTGMRTSEACDLDRDRVDLAAGVLVLADSKFGKSRQVFLHPSTVAALRGYQRRRDHWCPAPAAPSFFVSTRGTGLDAHNLPHTFADLVDAAGIAAPPGRFWAQRAGEVDRARALDGGEPRAAVGDQLRSTATGRRDARGTLPLFGTALEARSWEKSNAFLAQYYHNSEPLNQ